MFQNQLRSFSIKINARYFMTSLHEFLVFKYFSFGILMVAFVSLIDGEKTLALKTSLARDFSKHVA